MDQLQGMRVFCAVADALGFRASANRLGMSAAMVSKHVNALETRIGARLFARNSRQVVLTEEGRVYYQKAKALLDELDELDASVRKQAQQIGGLIRLSAPVWMANERFASILQAFNAAHPGITFDIDLSAHPVRLIEDGYDLALRVSPRLDPGLIAKPLIPISFGLYASPDYVVAHGAPGSLDEVLEHPLLVYSGSTRLEEMLGARRRKRGTAKSRTLITSENELLLRHAALAGMGLVVLPDWLAQPDVEGGKLTRLLPDSFEVGVKLHAVYADRRLLPARIRKFLDFLASA